MLDLQLRIVPRPWLYLLSLQNLTLHLRQVLAFRLYPRIGSQSFTILRCHPVGPLTCNLGQVTIREKVHRDERLLVVGQVRWNRRIDVNFWRMTVLSYFGDYTFGPSGELAFDRNGNIYGTTEFGGPVNGGIVFEWSGSLNVLYSARELTDGMFPGGGVIPDSSGNLFGVFSGGGPNQAGFVFELSPSQQGWTIQLLASFSGSYAAVSGLVFDSHGSLYGRRGGAVFQLAKIGGAWNMNWIGDGGSSAPWSYARLTVDSTDAILGTGYDGGAYGMGSVFKLTYQNGNWIKTTLHDFCPDAPTCSEGAQPASSVAIDTHGNLYGTTTAGGAYGYGVVWEITP